MSSNGESFDCRKEFFSSAKHHKCLQCQKEFPDFSSILDHHCLPYECEQCSKKFEHSFQLNFHECSNKDINKSKKCSFCNSTFVTVSLFKLHESSCSEKRKICDRCNRACPNGKCKCKVVKNKKNKKIVTYLSCNGNAFCEETSLTESSKDISCDNKLTDINSEIKLDDVIMNSEKTKNRLDSQPQVNKHPSNLNNSNKKKPTKFVKPKLHFSGKFKSSKRIKNNHSPEIRKSCDETVKKPKTRKNCVVKQKAQNSKVLKKKMSDITTEFSNTTVFSDNTSPECDMPTNEETSEGKIITKNSNLKDASSLKVILSDAQKLPDVNLLKENIVENYENHSLKSKANNSIMENFAKHLQSTFESSSNITFNGIHSSRSAVEKTKPKKQASASSKSIKKRKADNVMRNAITDTQISGKGESDLPSGHSPREFSPVKKKIRKSRSSSKELDSGIESWESLSTSSSMSANSVTLKIKNSVKTKKTSSPDSEIGSSLQESNSLQQRHRKDTIKKSVVNDSNRVLAKALQHMPLELEISESTLNDIPDDHDFQKVCHLRQKEEFYVKGKRFVTKGVKTENNIELGDLLNSLPSRCSILLRASPGSFHNFKCPKCTKLFKHMTTGSSHFLSCRAKFKKNILIAYNEIIYVCTTCHYYSTRKFEITNHKITCIPNSVSDFLLNYDYSTKRFICSKCSFSCISSKGFNVHNCTERLEQMKMCTVEVKKIDPYQFQFSDGTKIVLDPIKYETPEGDFLPQAAAVKAQIFTGAGNALSQKGKKFFAKAAAKCNTVDDIMKNVVKPVTQLNSAIGTKNSCPDLDLDVTLPFECQKLVAVAAEKYLSENKSNTCKEIFRIETPFDNDDDSDESNPDPQVQKLIAQLKTYKCKCKKPQFDAEIENKPCIPCLNVFVKTYFLTDVTSSPKKDSEPSTSAASTSQINSSNLQQEISVQASSSVANPSSDISSNTSVLGNIASIPNECTMPTISSVASTSSPTSDITSIANTEMLLQSMISMFGKNTSTSANANPPQELKQSDMPENNAEPNASHSCKLNAAVCDGDKCASPDPFPVENNKLLDYVEKCCEGISDNVTPPGNEETSGSLDVPSVDNVKLDNNNPNSQQLVSTNSDAKKALPSANSEENEALPSANSVQNELLPCTQSELNESGLPTSSTHPVNSSFQKGELTFTSLRTECTVSSSELKMTVTTLRDIQNDLVNNEQFQDILIDLFTNLKSTLVSGNDDSIFETALDIICVNKLDFVEIIHNSIRFCIDSSLDGDFVEYSGYILKSAGQYVCSECEENFSPLGLIGHIIHEHKKINIYISLIESS